MSPSALRCRGKWGGGHRCGVTTAMAVAHRCDDCIGSCTFGEEGCNGSFHRCHVWRCQQYSPHRLARQQQMRLTTGCGRREVLPCMAPLSLLVCFPLMEPREFHLSDCSKESSVCRLRGLGAEGTREFLLSSPSQQLWACRLYGLLSTPLS